MVNALILRKILYFMKRIFISALVMLLFVQANAQDSLTVSNSVYVKQKPYWVSTSELILSGASVENNGVELDNIARFSAFFHVGEQIHFDFSKNVGFYTGIALRNVGMINDLNDSVRIKQRVYTIGIPAAFKVGNMKGTNLALGAEAEFAIAYKQKVFVNDEKSKTNEWFSDRTNIFLPSAFAEIRMKHGGYIKFKYYLTDFLVEDKQKVNVTNVNFTPNKSQMFYLSFGFAIETKKASKYSSGKYTSKI
jgi:hypothetical protein